MSFAGMAIHGSLTRNCLSRARFIEPADKEMDAVEAA
jgi:hypothetical protein